MASWRILRLCRDRLPATGLKIIWVLAVLWYELGVYYHSVGRCSWPDATLRVVVRVICRDVIRHLSEPFNGKEGAYADSTRRCAYLGCRGPANTRPPFLPYTPTDPHIPYATCSRSELAEELESCPLDATPRCGISGRYDGWWANEHA
jgi:hypothetical protein